MKILITGSGGYIADNIAGMLSFRKNYQLYGIGRSHKKNNFKSKFVKIVKGNINKKNLKKLKINPDCIIICSGSGTANITKNKKTHYDNVLANNVIISSFCNKKNKIKIIFISSAAVYKPKLNKLSEKSKIEPVSIYGKLKKQSEKNLIEMQRKFNFNLIILRVFSIYGVGLKKQIIWDAFNKFKLNKNIFNGSGEEKRDFINISDFLDVVKILLEKNFRNKVNIFNVGSAVSYKIKYVISKISKFYNNKNITFNNLENKKIPKNMICNNKKLKSLGWKPKKKFNIELKRYFIWYKNQK